MNQLEAKIEGLLFLVGDEGIDLKTLANILEEDVAVLDALMASMVQQYQEDKRGILIQVLGNRYKLTTNPLYYSVFQSLVQVQPNTLSNAALETLAIIAYNQPVTRSEIESIRGVGCDAMLKRLSMKSLIKEVGKDQTKVGRPVLYGVTETFMDYFKLASLDELPEIKQEEVETQEDLFDTKYREIKE